MNNMQKAFKKKGACGLADGGRPNPNMLGSGLAAGAGLALGGRQRQIEGALQAPAPAAPAAPPPVAGGLSARRDSAVPPASMLLAQRRGMADGGEPLKRKPHGGEVEGPGGPTDDEAGVFALSNDEYVLPADTVEAMGGAETLDQIRDATHEFVDEGNRPGLANGGEPSWFQKQRAIAQSERAAATAVKGGVANPEQQALYEKNQASLNNPEVMNPLAEVPGVGLASRAASTAVAKTPGLVAGAIGGLRAGANKVTSFVAGKVGAPAVSAVPAAAGKVAPGAVSGGFTNAQRIAATPKGYVTGGLAQPGASAASRLASGQMPTAGRIAANAATTASLATGSSYVPGTGLPSAEQVASDKARGEAANARVPGLNNSRFVADNAALSREQAGRSAAAHNKPLENGGRYQDPEAARAFADSRTAEQFSPAMVGIVNKGIRARQNTPGSIDQDNARFASDGFGDVTKSVGADGRVTYGNDTPNPHLGTKFSNGQTGQEALDTRRKNDATNLQEGLARAAKDRDTLDALVQDRVARETGFEKGAAAEAAIRLEQSKVAGAERTGLAKARADMAKAVQDQKNFERGAARADSAEFRAAGNQRRQQQQTLIEQNLGPALGADKTPNAAYNEFAQAMQSTLAEEAARTKQPVRTLDDVSEQELQSYLNNFIEAKQNAPGDFMQLFNKYIRSKPYVPGTDLNRTGLNPEASAASGRAVDGYGNLIYPEDYATRESVKRNSY